MATIPPDAPFLRIEKNGDVLVDVHVVPNAAKTQPVGLHGEPGQLALRLRLQVPPVDGKANQALIRWLAHSLGVPQNAITPVRGETSRRKQLRVSAAVASRAAWDDLVAAIPSS
ncbi:DUF167 domain-containing protein [Polaromonas sp. JS666]|uniref:DUF167 domain-containing protein n=1 Tax=Polaromonas sp. (strain JS666 / ATCC BAA-500) TaxID=296591 RepID=UPI00004640AA|nr:DUF167 domain-containing protein [Polaromonas sp. JS666]ABE43056.1 protein of unknown function DUF167 [Polaromonas sp. JS666]